MALRAPLRTLGTSMFASLSFRTVLLPSTGRTSDRAVIRASWGKQPCLLSRDFQAPVSVGGSGKRVLKTVKNGSGGSKRSTKGLPVDKRSCSLDSNSFLSLGLSPLVQRSLEEQALTVATDVQAFAIPVLLDGYDAAIQSYTGSGKTLAYLLPLLTKVGPLKAESEDPDAGEIAANSKRGIEAVVVVPSRELAMQIVREAEKLLGSEHKKAVQQLVGGANRSRQEEALKKNKPSIVVGTPGRISEISRAGKLHTHRCRVLVLDEADWLLSIEFREDMRRILEHVGRRRSTMVRPEGFETRESSSPNAFPHERMHPDMSYVSLSDSKKGQDWVERQTIFVSATMPFDVLRAVSAWGHQPLLVTPESITNVDPTTSPADMSDLANAVVRGAKASLPPALQHFYSACQLRFKVDTLRRCIHALDAQSVIVFMNHSKRLKDTVFKLEARGIAATSLHGELGKLERSNALAAFKSGKLRVLVVSEVGARGIDVPSCDLVVNLELPTDSLHYVHRAGRTGRLGRKGVVLSICEESEAFIFKKFSRQLDISIKQCKFAEGKLVLCKERDSNRVQSKEVLSAGK